jgi:predicted RNA-binding Zn-ribbon protein involved in translation (DUF1610 family)
MNVGERFDVIVTVHAGTLSSFVCPDCGTVIKYANKYPTNFMWKVCPDCRVQWLPDPGAELGPHREWPTPLAPGTELPLTILRGHVVRR